MLVDDGLCFFIFGGNDQTLMKLFETDAMVDAGLA